MQSDVNTSFPADSRSEPATAPDSFLSTHALENGLPLHFSTSGFNLPELQKNVTVVIVINMEA